MKLLAVASLLLSLGLSSGGPNPLEPSVDLASPSGEVALDNWPFCDFFVIHGATGFSLAAWRSGMWMWGEDDKIYGRTDRPGLQTLFVAGSVMSGEMTVLIEEAGVDLRRAQRAYHDRCHSS